MSAELLEMLSYCRPAGSRHEREFIDRYVLTLPGVHSDYCKPFSNWHVEIGDSPDILWSCHTDTVHRESRRQNVREKKGVYRLHKRERRSNCLGADDTAGVYILRQMILAGVPGHYVFHACEEHGGKGSSALAVCHPSWLAGFKYAIAVDRAGFRDVITHQMNGRTASDLFAWSLADALEKTGHVYDYRPDSTGMYTDTAEYSDIIGECTNLSVGYLDAHSHRESLDREHVDELLKALIALDQSSLQSDRLPGTDDPPSARGAILSLTTYDDDYRGSDTVIDIQTRRAWERTGDADLTDDEFNDLFDASEYLDPDYAAFMRDYRRKHRFSRGD